MKNQTPHIYPGCLHIHTTFSDGSGSVLDVITAAREAGLRWMIISDHDTLRGKSFEGWHDDLLVVVAHEVTPFRSHYMALDTGSQVIDKNQTVQQYIDEVYDVGGFGIILHPDDHEQDKSTAIHPWLDWSIDGPSEREGRSGGLELWNWMSDWRSKHKHYPTQQLLETPNTVLTGPTSPVLEWWDRLNQEGRRTFGVGGLDAHATPWRGGTAFPYVWMFGTLTNYLLLDEPLAADSQQATRQLLGALAQGRSYFCNRLDGTPPDLPCSARQGDKLWLPGDSPSLANGALTLHAAGDADTETRLVHNGQVIASAAGSLQQQLAQPGVYRVEGQRHGRKWLYTNPLFVTP